MSKMKNILNEINSSLNTEEKKCNELEDAATETIHNETRGKKLK